MPVCPIPDLLCAEPAVRVDLVQLREMLVFAFAAGGEVASFERILAEAVFPRSTWERTSFARDLFLDELCARCLPVRVAGRDHLPCLPYLLRVIAEPPRDRNTLLFRRRILEELVARPDARSDFERLYGDLVRLRVLLSVGPQPSRWLQRLDILRVVHALFATLAGSFPEAASGLARLRTLGLAVTASEAYRRLDALLDHEQHLGTVDLRVRIGSDGALRTFQIVAIRENSDNPFHTSPLGRWVARLRLFFQGYRMQGGEVIERLFDEVFTGIEEPLAMLFQLLGDMEVYLAALGLRDRALAQGLSVSFPALLEVGQGGGMTFRGLFNPLMLTDTQAPVPCAVDIPRAGSVVIVTGPNSGGKTRLLQAIAIAQMLGEAGLFVPAAEARFPRVSGLFVSLVEGARADQPEGQLGMELLRIRRMFEHLEVGSLVMLDELCSGTNPSEGEEIARLVLSLLPELDAQVFVTTHLLSFAQRLAEEPSIERLSFLQVELDARERPTYGFVPGVATTSLAQQTAARLGVTREELLELIAAKKQTRRPQQLPPSG